MSRIGNEPVEIAKDVAVTITATAVVFKGTKGEQTVVIPDGIVVVKEGETLVTSRTRNDKKTKALHGTVAALMKNAIIGVTKGWTKQLELSGVGNRAALAGTSLTIK